MGAFEIDRPALVLNRLFVLAAGRPVRLDRRALPAAAATATACTPCCRPPSAGGRCSPPPRSPLPPLVLGFTLWGAGEPGIPGRDGGEAAQGLLAEEPHHLDRPAAALCDAGGDGPRPRAGRRGGFRASGFYDLQNQKDQPLVLVPGHRRHRLEGARLDARRPALPTRGPLAPLRLPPARSRWRPALRCAWASATGGRCSPASRRTAATCAARRVHPALRSDPHRPQPRLRAQDRLRSPDRRRREEPHRAADLPAPLLRGRHRRRPRPLGLHPAAADHRAGRIHGQLDGHPDRATTVQGRPAHGGLGERLPGAGVQRRRRPLGGEARAAAPPSSTIRATPTTWTPCSTP